MHNLIQQLKKITSASLFSADNKTQQPLLNNDEILELLLRVQNNKKSHSHQYDISFRKIGDVRSIYRGHGMDYEESRLYQSGDDPRYMNWQLSARTGQHYMKVFREERQPGIFILIDRRNSMRFGTQQRLKITQAVRAAAIAAFSAQENNFSIGGVILDDEIEWFKENQNKQAVFDFIHKAACPADPVATQTEDKQANIADVLRVLNEILTTGSIVYLISDFSDLEENSQPTLLQLSSSHQVQAIQVTDPAEQILPIAGTASFKETINDKYIDIDTNSKLEQGNYKARALDYFSNKKHLFEDIAIPFQQILTTDEDIEKITAF